MILFVVVSFQLAGKAYAAKHDGTFCPDLPNKTEVLREGQDYLNLHGGPIRRRTSFGYANEHEPPSEVASTSANSQWTDYVIDKFSLESEKEQYQAISGAEHLSNEGNFKSAHRLLSRVLAEIDKADADPGRLALVLKRTTDTAILSSIDFAERNSTTDRPVERKFHKAAANFNLYDRHGVEAAILLDADISVIASAQKAYERAMMLGRNSSEYKTSMLSNILLLAACEERLGHLDGAKKLLVEATSVNKAAVASLGRYAVAHGDFDLLREFESRLKLQAVESPNPSYNSILLSYYQRIGSRDEARNQMQSVMANSKFLPASVLIAQMSLYESADCDELCRYIASVWTIPFCHDPDLVAVIEAMYAHHLKKQADAILESIEARPQPRTSDLMIVAECYRSTNNPDKAVATYMRALQSLRSSADSLNKVLSEIAAVETELRSPMLSRAAKRKEGLNTAISQKKLQEEQIRLRQCLTMAADLNTTAFDLERSGHDEKAQKLYINALEIKQLNLDKDDPEIALQMADVGRVCATLNQAEKSQEYFEKSLKLLRESSRASQKVLIQTLQDYGQSLNRMNLTTKADRVYDEARSLAAAAAKN